MATSGLPRLPKARACNCDGDNQSGRVQPYKRASQIIVPTSAAGFKLVRNHNVMGEEGSDYASHAEVRYVNCRIPQRNLFGR